MAPVTCPSCGEKGNVPDQVVGKRLKCQKCGVSFVAGAAPTTPPPHAPIDTAKPAGDAIEVDGLDPSTWAATTVAVEPLAAEPPHEQHGPTHVFTASPQGHEPEGRPARQYKVLTQKDRFFEGKFELARLEEALNHYASKGWVVRAMATPHVTGFSGGAREELVILLER